MSQVAIPVPDQLELPRVCEWCGKPPVGIKILDPGEVKDQIRGGQVYRNVIRLPVNAYACQDHMDAKAGDDPTKILSRKDRSAEQLTLLDVPQTHSKKRPSGLLDG